MSSHTWLLVEFVDEKELFSSYSVVNSNQLLKNDDNMYSGKIVFVRTRPTFAQQGQVIRTSENKVSLLELKCVLERKERQIEQVVSICKSAIADMKTGGSLYINPLAQPSSSTVLRHNPVFDSDDYSDSNNSFIESDRKLNTNFTCTKKVILDDHDLAESSQNHTFVSSTPSRKRDKKHIVKVDKGIQCCLKSAGKDKKGNKILLEKVARVYLETANLLSKGIADGQNIKEKLEKLKILPKSKTRTITTNVMLKTVQTNILSASASKPVDAEAKIGEEIDSQVMEKDSIGEEPPIETKKHTTETKEDTAVNNNSKNLEMIPIGSGATSIPATVMNNINWNSHTNATRSLLLAAFPRRVLATHSLTGKPSPAFSNKPPKQRLNPQIIDDIIQTVSERSKVSKREVRSSITIKCADETKLYKSRLEKLNERRKLKNQENNPPSNKAPTP